jgi:hypothetical protein
MEGNHGTGQTTLAILQDRSAAIGTNLRAWQCKEKEGGIIVGKAQKASASSRTIGRYTIATTRLGTFSITLFHKCE